MYDYFTEHPSSDGFAREIMGHIVARDTYVFRDGLPADVGTLRREVEDCVDRTVSGHPELVFGMAEEFDRDYDEMFDYLRWRFDDWPDWWDTASELEHFESLCVTTEDVRAWFMRTNAREMLVSETVEAILDWAAELGVGNREPREACLLA